MNSTAVNGVTRLTLSFLLSLLSDNNYPGPEAPVTSKHHWSYKGAEGPDTWHVHYKYCAGQRQSPIDILPVSCEYDPSLEPIILDHFDQSSDRTGPCVMNITNNGHAASVRITSDDMIVRGGGLQGTYRTSEFHFHWGSTDDLGSEHAVEGHKFPLEMHVVSYAEKYGSLKQAMMKPDGLAVMGVFFQLSEINNPHFSVLEEALKHVHKAGEHNLVEQFVLRSLLPEDVSRYWRYNGSLTTPYCFESVIWTVFAEPQKISHSQLESLRSLFHEEGHETNDRSDSHIMTPSRLTDNWRPLQPLHDRKVFRSFVDSPQQNVYPNQETTSTTIVPREKTDNGSFLPLLNLSPFNQVYPQPNISGSNLKTILSTNQIASTRDQTFDNANPKSSDIPIIPASNQTAIYHENSIQFHPPSSQPGNIANILFQPKLDSSPGHITSWANPIKTVPVMNNEAQNKGHDMTALTADAGSKHVTLNGTNVKSSLSPGPDDRSMGYNYPGTTLLPFVRPSQSPERSENQGHDTNQSRSQGQQPRYQLPLSYLLHENRDNHENRFNSVNDVNNRKPPANQNHAQPQARYTYISSDNLRTILEKLAASNRINTRAPSASQVRLTSNANFVAGPDFTNIIRDRDGTLLMINRASGELFKVRPTQNNINLSSGNVQHHSQDAMSQQAYSIISPPKSYLPGAPPYNGDMLSRSNSPQVFLPRLERPIRINVPYYSSSQQSQNSIQAVSLPQQPVLSPFPYNVRHN